MNKEILNCLNNYKFDYKDNLNLPKNVLFGLEIEYENLNKINFPLPDDWINKDEETITDGGEINSNPLVDTKKTWNKLKFVLESLEKEGAKMHDAASGHIHFDSSILNRNFNTWLKLIKAWIMYEPIIYKFSSGEKESLRSFCESYAFYLRYLLLNNLDNFDCTCDSEELINKLNNLCTRCYGLCLSNVDRNFDKNTIEIRCPDGSLNPTIWQNNVNFFANFLLSINQKEIDEELFKYRKEKYYLEPRYGKNYLKENISLALELSDFVFTDDESKIKFLKQYTKRF